MKELISSNPELESKIIKLVEKGNLLHDDKHYNDALIIYQEAWEMLPDDKEWFLLTYWIAGCLYNVYFDMKEFQLAKKWILISIKGQTSEIDVGGPIDLGVVCYELGEFNEAYHEFHKAYKIGKKRAFRGLEKKYVEFYLENNKNKKY